MAKPRPRSRPPTLRLARGLAREASDGLPILRLAQGLARKASDGEPILRLARGPAREASDEVPILRLARGRLGNNPVASASTDLPDRMSCPINATNHSRNISRTTARHSRAADEMGSRISTIPSGTGQERAGVTGRCARYYAHDRRSHCTVLPNPCSRNNAAWGVKFGSL